MLLGRISPAKFEYWQYKKLIILKANINYIYLNWDDCPKVLLPLRDDLRRQPYPDQHPYVDPNS